MDKILIVGSGASGVHFALSVLKKGYYVTMLDVGYEKPEVVNPEDDFIDLKNKLNDPTEYFLGQDYEAVMYPDFTSEYYGFPPSKNYVFLKTSKFHFRSLGFAPLSSFAHGGLAEAWTAAVDTFNDDELEDFPFRYSDIEPYYSEVSERLGITGERDDLERFFPFHKNIMEPLELDEHSKLLLSELKKRRDYLNNKLNCHFGRLRIATISHDRWGRKGCRYCGRCLWGCPSESLYTPLITLNQCKQYPNFKYIPNIYVSHFEYNSKRNITKIIAESIWKKECHEFSADKLILAAGTLSSSKIFIDSIFKKTGDIIKLHGLMDNRQIFVPFLNLKMIGKPYNPQSYQYTLLAFGITSEKHKEYIHANITTLKTALVHPIIQNMLFDLETSIYLFRNIRAATGLVNVNLYDDRREHNFLTIECDEKSSNSRLVINYIPSDGEKMLIKESVKKVRKVLYKIGCIAPLSMIHIRPKGASVHYAGTIPMSTKRTALTTTEYCKSNDFDNLYIVDGTTLPFLPAKNSTFTLMANAVRVAESVF